MYNDFLKYKNLKIMKKPFLTFALFVFTSLAFSQEEKQQNDQDKIQQEPPRPTQRDVERAAKVDAIIKQSDKELKAEKQAKAKSSTQKQTTGEPVSDTLKIKKRDTMPR